MNKVLISIICLILFVSTSSAAKSAANKNAKEASNGTAPVVTDTAESVKEKIEEVQETIDQKAVEVVEEVKDNDPSELVETVKEKVEAVEESVAPKGEESVEPVKETLSVVADDVQVPQEEPTEQSSIDLFLI